MQVFVSEFICGGALGGQPLPGSLRVEGWAMLTSIVADLGRVHGLEVWATLDRRLCDQPFPPCRVEPAGPLEEARLFDRLAAQSDGTLVIAPEFDHHLEDRCWRVEAVGGRLLGPSPEGVRRAADKLAISRCLAARGVPAIPTRPAAWQALGRGAGNRSYPLVIKPRAGAGSQRTFVVTTDAGLRRLARRARAEQWSGEPVVQPWMAGTAASVGFLVGPTAVVPLIPGLQRISRDGALRYLGGSLPLDAGRAERAVALGRRAVESIPGLRGYVGVDLILGGHAAGRAAHSECATDWVVEINPRLTTAYIGYRAMIVGNLAERMLRVVRGEPVTPPAWRDGRIDFTPDGRVIHQGSCEADGGLTFPI